MSILVLSVCFPLDIRLHHFEESKFHQVTNLNQVAVIN